MAAGDTPELARTTHPASKSPLYPVVIAVACYCILALLAYWPVLPFAGSRIVGGDTGDPVQAVWFLSWTPFAVSHGHNPFFTDYLAYPSGANLASNTLMPLLGLLAWPVTAAFGPVATFNFLVRLALAASATSMCLVLRTWTKWWPAAFVGGLLYGFGSYMSAQGSIHLNLAFVPLPPLLLWCLNELLVSQRRPPARVGLLLGLLGAAQLFIDAEVLADCVVVGAIGVLGLAVSRRSEVVSRARTAAPGLATAAAAFAVVSAYPIWFLVAGPQHAEGPIYPVWLVAQYHADLLSPIERNLQHVIIRPNGKVLRLHGAVQRTGDSSAYLGIPLTAVTLVFVIVWRRVGVIRLAGVMAFASFILSLGPHIIINRIRTNVPMPGILLTHVPLLDDTVWRRYALLLMFSVSIVLGVGIDRLGEHLRHGLRDWRIGRQAGKPSPFHSKRLLQSALPSVLCVSVAAVSLYPLGRTYPLTSGKVTWPGRLVSSLSRSVPSGGVVLAFPHVVSSTDAPMAWQAIDEMQFRLVGGYVIVPDPRGDTSFHVTPTQQLREVDDIMARAENGTLSARNRRLLPIAKRACRDLPGILRLYSVDALVVWPTGAHPSLVRRFLEPVLGRPSRRFTGALVWYHVRHDLNRPDCSIADGHFP
jgi:hypothetical protein